MALYAPTRGNKGTQQKLAFVAVTVFVLLSLAGCSGGGEEPQTATPSGSQQQAESEPQQPVSTPGADGTAIPEPETDFGDDLDIYQGEWQQTGSRYLSVIINGAEVNFIHETSIKDKSYRSVNTFIFAYDDSGTLIVANQHSQPCYNISIDENGVLSISNISGKSDVRTYTKVSDNVDAPAEILEPAIGMTENEVYASTWGAPKKKNRTETAYGVREQWVYDEGYIYFEDGRVTSIQD